MTDEMDLVEVASALAWLRAPGGLRPKTYRTPGGGRLHTLTTDSAAPVGRVADEMGDLTFWRARDRQGFSYIYSGHLLWFRIMPGSTSTRPYAT